MSSSEFRVDSAAVRGCVAVIAVGAVVGGIAVGLGAVALEVNAGELVVAGALLVAGLALGWGALRWRKVTAGESGIAGLEPHRLPWSSVEDIWETHLSQRQPWPQRMVVRTANASFRVWTSRPVIARCRKLAGLDRG